MQDNSLNDDEIKDSPLSPKLGGKKLKLNDGSSQDSNKDTASGSKVETEENADSGVSADKSESTSSGTAAPEVPLNEVVTIAPSSSNVRAILLNIRRPRRSRNYRKRKTPDRESGSDNSSRDSDDLSTEEADNIPFLLDTTDGDGATDFSNGSASESSLDTSSNSSYHSGDLMNTADTDSDDQLWSRNNETEAEEFTGKPPPVLLKTRPKHTYLILREIINREMGLTFPCGKATQNDVIFEQKFYGSLHAVHRLEKLHNLLKHKGCVNSINFHPEGRLLASGSDDMNVVVWDWAKKIPIQTVKTGHKSNVFQSKFLHLNAQSQLNIATCARDGQVRLVQCGGCGGGSARRRLAAHARAAHKLAVWPADPHLVLSAGEDGLVLCSDVRDDHPTKMIHAKGPKGGAVALYSVAVHPHWRHEVLVAGRDKYLRVYDARRALEPLAMYWPGHFRDETDKETQRKRNSMHLTCAVYNHDGTEILGSYNDEDIYLFNAKKDIYEGPSDTKDGYTHRYSGHRNSATYKGVAFFGPKSEYIVSGSDCSNIYIWEKETEAIVQWMKGDFNGVVNCIETHPRFPVMATSGLDKDVKIWIPKRESDPTYEGIEKVVRENSMSHRSPLFNDFLPTLYSAWRHENRMFSDYEAMPTYGGGNIEFDGNVCTPF